MSLIGTFKSKIKILQCNHEICWSPSRDKHQHNYHTKKNVCTKTIFLKKILGDSVN